MLTNSEYETIVITAYEMRRAREREDDSLMNLVCLVREVLLECGPFWLLFYSYVCILRQEAELIRPVDAYAAGKELRASGTDVFHAFYSYLNEVFISAKARSVSGALQSVYTMLVKVCGGKNGLIQEFTAEYRRLRGLSWETVDLFFWVGFGTQKNTGGKRK